MELEQSLITSVRKACPRRKFLTTSGFEALHYPRYSPDLAPSDSYMFANMKTNLHGKTFGRNQGVIHSTMLLISTWGTRKTASILKV